MVISNEGQDKRHDDKRTLPDYRCLSLQPQSRMRRTHKRVQRILNRPRTKLLLCNGIGLVAREIDLVSPCAEESRGERLRYCAEERCCEVGGVVGGDAELA